MTDISSVSQQKQNNISSSTKVTLESLGVNISTVSSESEAKALIEKLKAAKAGNQTQAEKKEQSEVASETETLEDAKSLASKMGLVLNNNTSADEVLRQISNKIREMASSDNPTERQMAQAYQAQLSTISNSYQAIQASQNSMYSAMDMMSINNKYSLNL